MKAAAIASVPVVPLLRILFASLQLISILAEVDFLLALAVVPAVVFAAAPPVVVLAAGLAVVGPGLAVVVGPGLAVVVGPSVAVLPLFRYLER